MRHATEVEPTERLDDRAYVEQLIRRIASECPQRAPGSRQERQAQAIVRQELRSVGGRSRWQRFVFSRNLYAVLALHFAIAALTLGLFFVHPLLAAGAALLVMLSYICDSNRWGYGLRRLLPWGPSQNLLVTFPARRRLRKRIVVTAHADAAYTGWLFQPWITGLGGGATFPKPLHFLGKPLLLATLGLFAVAAMEVDMWLRGSLWPRFPVLFVVCYLFFAVVAILNLQIVWRRQLVPGCERQPLRLRGAACFGASIVERRLGRRGIGLRRDRLRGGRHRRRAGVGAADGEGVGSGTTDIVVLDSLSGGSLCLYQEGELLPIPIPPRLRSTAELVATQDARFAALHVFPLPAGATDAMSFLAGGYEAMGVGCVDKKLGTPRHYHLPADSPDNLDYDQLMTTIDFSEQLIVALSGEGRMSHVAAASSRP